MIGRENWESVKAISLDALVYVRRLFESSESVIGGWSIGSSCGQAASRPEARVALSTPSSAVVKQTGCRRTVRSAPRVGAATS